MDAAEVETPTRLDALWWRLRTLRHKALRTAANLAHPIPRVEQRAPLAHTLSSSSSPLWTSGDPRERPLVAGKIENLRRAAQKIDGALVKSGETFSFWSQVGPPWALFGFVDGRELREGCLVPSVGGGLCQLSNALYQCALDAGCCTVIERHAHTAKLVGAAASSERDATVFYPYVDLRFRADVDVVIRARLIDARLEVAFTARAAPAAVAPSGAGVGGPRVAAPSSSRATLVALEHGCDTCGVDTCDVGVHARARITHRAARSAFLVDEHVPELAALIDASSATQKAQRAPHAHEAQNAQRQRRTSKAAAVLAVPLPGALFGMPQYAWDTRGFDVIAAPLVALRRSRGMRALAHEGAARVRALLAHDAALAAAYGRFLGADVEHVLAAQSLLPHLWTQGHLGGRSFDAFLTRLPLHLLHEKLDAAAALFPDDELLHAYRAPAALVDAEAEALAHAARIFTPHPEIARLVPRATLVPWAPSSSSSSSSFAGARVDRAARRIVFPGPAAGRKGAHAVRDAARALGLVVVLTGSDLLPADFWAGVVVERTPWARAFSRPVRAVVQPALVEDRPRRLLDAVAAGVPVIATAACGVAGATLVPFADAPALFAALAPDAHAPSTQAQRGHASSAGTHSGVPDSVAHAR